MAGARSGFEIVVSGLALLCSVLTKPDPTVPLPFGTAMLMWALGDVVLTLEFRHGMTPASPSPAELFYLAFFPLAYLAIVRMVRWEAIRMVPSLWLDGVHRLAGRGHALCGVRLPQHRGNRQHSAWSTVSSEARGRQTPRCAAPVPGVRRSSELRVRFHAVVFLFRSLDDSTLRCGLRDLSSLLDPFLSTLGGLRLQVVGQRAELLVLRAT
jgi:hypothetical protein